jgi:dihydroorotase
MLVDNPDTLEKIFSSTKLLIAVHCEDENTIKSNLEKYKAQYGDDIPVKYHHLIRSEEACYLSSSKAIELAKNRSTITCFPSFNSERNGVVYQ